MHCLPALTTSEPERRRGRVLRRHLNVAALALLSAIAVIARAASLEPIEHSQSTRAGLSRPDTDSDRRFGIEPNVLPREPTPLTAELRSRGYNACYMPDVGFGRYSTWQRLGSGAQMIVPRKGGHTPDWGYDVVIHFHGRDAVRGPFVEAARGAVLVGIDLGIVSASYSRAFEDRGAFIGLVANITKGLQQSSGQPEAHIRNLAISSWSAGFGAVTKILARHPDAVDSVVLLDSLHSDYGERTDGETQGVRRIIAAAPIEPVLAMAARAVRGDAILFLSHSEIIPPGYASTTEVADYLIEQVAGVRSLGEGMNSLGARLLTTFDGEGMHVRGYEGGDKLAHCAHVALLAEAVRDYLEPVWSTPEALEPD